VLSDLPGFFTLFQDLLAQEARLEGCTEDEVAIRAALFPDKVVDDIVSAYRKGGRIAVDDVTLWRKKHKDGVKQILDALDQEHREEELAISDVDMDFDNMEGPGLEPPVVGRPTSLSVESLQRALRDSVDDKKEMQLRAIMMDTAPDEEKEEPQVRRSKWPRNPSTEQKSYE
jgi:hypothetical protein